MSIMLFRFGLITHLFSYFGHAAINNRVVVMGSLEIQLLFSIEIETFLPFHLSKQTCINADAFILKTPSGVDGRINMMLP